nr:MAG TPA: hypothetical protein [Caudoviricetes sp.]
MLGGSPTLKSLRAVWLTSRHTAPLFFLWKSGVDYFTYK